MWKSTTIRKVGITAFIFRRQSSKSMFYYPEGSRPIMRNMEIWKTLIKFRNEQAGKKIRFMQKEMFYTDALKVLEKAIFLLEKYSIPVTSTIQIAQVSTVNADYSIAITIAESFDKVGPFGLKMIVEGNQFNDELEVVSGVLLQNVMIHPMFVTDCSGIDVFENCALVLYDDKVESFNEIKDLIQMVGSKHKQAVYVFSSCNRKALHDIVQMKLKEKLDIVVAQLVQPEMLSSVSLTDISVLTDTEISRQNYRDVNLEKIVGNVDKIYFSDDQMLLLGIRAEEKKVADYVASLFGDLSIIKNKLSFLMNNEVALIKIGGVDKVDVRKRMGLAVDTLGRAEQAVNHGLVVGDGRCLLDIIEQLSNSLIQSQQYNGGSIVIIALKYYFNRLHQEKQSYYELSSEKSVAVPKFFGYDNKSKQYVNLIAEGLLYPKSNLANSLMYAKQKCTQYVTGYERDAEDDI